MTGKEIKATYIGGSAYYDLAVLYVENSELLRQSMATAVEIADSDRIMPGDVAIAVGNPQGAGLASSDGVISVDSERITLSGSEDSMRVIRVDTPINKGNSGGGLYNENGQLIGIVNAKIISSVVENIGYAIPSNVVVAVADNIIDHCFESSVCCVMRPLVGITITTGDTKAVFDETTGRIRIVETVTVYEVSETSAFYQKMQVGDVLVSITVDGQEKQISRQHHILDEMLTARVGDTVSFHVLRGEEAYTFSVILDASSFQEY